MEKYRTKQYQIMTDQNEIWDFMTEIYERNWSNGVAAPFYEYAVSSSWMDTSYLYLNRMWYDGDKLVAFIFDESPVTDIYFSLRPGYEELADEMIEYAEANMPNFDNKQQLVIFEGQKALAEAAKRHGYKITASWDDLIFDFKNDLDYQLPEGYHIVDRRNADPVKLARLCWQGFDHEKDKGPFVNYDAYDDSMNWTPAKSAKGVFGTFYSPSPHSTNELDVIIADNEGEYACYSGMWWVEKDKLAYMEPLCTTPAHRGKGLARAALSIHYHRMKALGATHMTGGGISFYSSIGYEKGIVWNIWKK